MLDLDNTLLNDEGVISDYTLNVLNKIKDKHIIVYNSARSLNYAMSVIEQFKPHYLILNSGATIYDSNFNLIFKSPIPLDITKKIIKDFKEANASRILIEAGNGFITDDLDYIAAHPSSHYMDLDKINIEPYKIVYHHENRMIGQMIANKYGIDFTTYVNTNIHKMCKETKGNGLINFKKVTKLKEPIVAIGDDLDDIKMLEAADYGVIVKNARPELFNYNFTVIGEANLDGVAKYLETL